MLVLDNISVRVAGRLLIENAAVRVPPRGRVGLVGRNGVGKSTLVGAIVGDVALEAGDIQLPARTRIGCLAQEAPDGPQSLIEVVLAADAERAALMAEAATASEPERISDIQTRLTDIDAHAAPARAAAILAGLGFSHAQQSRPCAEFSGGWRMRVALAATLFARPDLLLLDEPTNYLDFEGTLWLKEHLSRYPHTMIIISHDRDLLDVAVDHILHLDQGRLALYRGNYAAFERQRRERLVLDQKLAAKEEARRKHMQAFVDRFRATASKARQAQSRLKLLARLEPAVANVTQEVREFVFAAPARALSPPIIALDEADVGYVSGQPVLRNLSLSIGNDDRIALLGANGNGKSTLVKLISGRMAATGGRVTRAAGLKIAYFAQHQLDELDPDASVYAHLRRLMPASPQAMVRARAGALGFSGESADTPVAKLSGGEKARLLLGLATFDAPHLIILDEPTNHLDIDSRAALVEAINAFAGAVIIVSHDRHLVEACAERLWLVADAAVTPFDGDLDDYRRLVLDARRKSDSGAARAAGATAIVGSPAKRRRGAAGKRAELAPLRGRVAAAEAEVARITSRLAQIDAALANPAAYAGDAFRGTALAIERSAAVANLAQAEEQWLALMGEYERASAS
ncbi:MAG: ABC-F family ATP-binding cassette domain-containing protein [Proteobacteria bacterium]|nr:ABC-F family ATP-binding cassette domain-containing protein [Pseudomonadota bacterium]